MPCTWVFSLFFLLFVSWLICHKPYVMRFAAVERHRESVCVSVSVWAIAFCLPLGHMCHLLGAKHTKTHFYMHASSAFLRELYIHFVLHLFFCFCFWVLIFGLWNEITTIAPLYLRWFFLVLCSILLHLFAFHSIPFDMFYSNLFALFTNIDPKRLALCLSACFPNTNFLILLSNTYTTHYHIPMYLMI